MSFCFTLVFLIPSSQWLVFSSNECAVSAQSLSLQSSGPTACLPLDDYLQVQGVGSDGKPTDVPTPTSRPPTPAVSRQTLLYLYMSPLWLHANANFTETPSSVSAQTIEFIASGSISRPSVLKVKLIEAGVLDDDKAYSLQIAFFFSQPGVDSDSILQICDDGYCVGFQYRDDGKYGVKALGGTNALDACIINEQNFAVAYPLTTNWNIRLEIRPNSSSGITYVGTNLMTYEYNGKLKPSQGLHFKVCRESTGEKFKYHLFELAVHLIE